MKRKIVALLLCFIMVFSLCATGCKKDPVQEGSVNDPDTIVQEDEVDPETDPNPECNHKIVVDPAKHATFSKSGLTEGSHCSKCGAVIKAQKTIPALGSDLVVGTDYYDKKGTVTYRYSYSFTLFDNDRFQLNTLKVGSDESYSLTTDTGKFNYLDNGVYELIIDGNSKKMYAQVTNGKFEFCNKDGSALTNGQSKRPQGTTKVNITPRAGNSAHGYYDLANNTHGTAMQELYYRMYASCEAFIKSGKDVKAQGGKYTIDKINLDYYVLTADEAVAVWKVFLVENPRYYWLSNTVQFSGGVLMVNIDPAYAKADYRKKCDAAIDAMSASCKAKLKSGMSQLQKALTIHDFVLGQMNYAYKSDGKTPQDAIWAHNMMGSAEKKSGVCEAYAKTYQYLCRLNGLDCIVATGYNGERHAWNMVSIDGKWYGVDCTFDETNTKNPAYHCFGMSASRMAEQYEFDTPQKTGVNYLYDVPSLNKQGIELVDLYKNGSFVAVYGNADAAFAAMTDASAEYEVQLQTYPLKGVLLMSAPAVEHNISASKLPKVKKITIRGKHIDLGNGYSTRIHLYVNKALTVQSNLDMYDVDVYGNGSLNIGSHKLRCLGTSLQFHIPITGSMSASSPSTIEAGELEHLNFYGSVKVHTFRHNHTGQWAGFRTDTEIVNVYTYIIGFDQFYDDRTMTVKLGNVYSSHPQGYLQVIATDAMNITIDNIETSHSVADVFLRFGKKQNMPKLTLGNFKVSDLCVQVIGQLSKESTDAAGNVVAQWTETVSFDELKGPLFTLKNPALYNNLRVYVCDPKDNSVITKDNWFSLNSKNQVVFTP